MECLHQYDDARFSAWSVRALTMPCGCQGVAVLPDDGECSVELFATADERLYEAKARGRNRLIGPD